MAKVLNKWIWLAGLALAAAGSVRAHHAGTAFDVANIRTISGTVEKFLWTNPHSWIYLKVPGTDGSEEEYHFEGMSISILARSGWNSQIIKPGDKVTITYAPYKNDRKGGEYRSVACPDGKVLEAGWGPL